MVRLITYHYSHTQTFSDIFGFCHFDSIRFSYSYVKLQLSST